LISLTASALSPTVDIHLKELISLTASAISPTVNIHLKELISLTASAISPTVNISPERVDFPDSISNVPCSHTLDLIIHFLEAPLYSLLR
jgi:hypothetical protein